MTQHMNPCIYAIIFYQWYYASFLCVILLFTTGCATLPYQVEQRSFKEALTAGQYDQAKAKIVASLDLVPAERKTDLETYFAKSLFRKSWRDYKVKNWDKSFDLMTTACQRATAELREDWSKERQKIAHQYATYHLYRANANIGSKDLKSAVAEYEAAGKADNDLGAEARAAFDKYTFQRKELEGKLETAKAQIEKEQWNDGMATIGYVRSQDTSLEPQCRELSELLTERHYQAAVRDCRAFLAKKDFPPAFLKANEALALNTTHTEAAELKSQIQKAFAESVGKQLKDALEKDARPVMEGVAKQYDEFELAADASQIRAVVANRTEADRNLALAQEHITADRHESAIEPLRMACGLWQENKRLAELYKDTRIHVGKDALSDAEKADKGKCPLVCALYCLKACQVCPTNSEIQEKARTVSAEAIAKVDRKAMETAFVVDVTVNKEIETTLDASRLREAIIQALPAASRFVVFVPAGEKQPEAPTIFRITVDVQALFASTQEQAYNKVVRYISDVAYDPNPAFIQLQAQLLAAQNELTVAMNEQAQANAQYNQAVNTGRIMNKSDPLANAAVALMGMGGVVGRDIVAPKKIGKAQSKISSISQQMETTSATIKRDIYSDYPYVVHQYQRRGTLKAVARMLNSEGQAIADKVITDNFQDSDTAHDGYGPAGLQEDPLTLPTEDDIRAQFVKKLYLETTGTASDFVGNYWQKVIAKASSIKEPIERWDRLLTIALQVPVMQKQATGEIRQTLSNIPDDFVEQIESQFADTEVLASSHPEIADLRKANIYRGFRVVCFTKISCGFLVWTILW